MLSNGEVQNETYTDLVCSPSKNEYNDTVSILRCKSSDSELSPQQHKKSYVVKVENSPNMNHVNESEICPVDNFVNDNACIQKEISLDEAFRDCINNCMSSDNSLDGNGSYDELIEVLNENDSTSKIHSNLQNHERKMVLTNEIDSDDSSSDIEGDDNKTKKIKITEEIENHSSDVPRQRPKSRQEIAVGIPNIFDDQSSEVEECKKSLKQFLQKGICLSLPPNIDKCIECRVYQTKKNLTKRDYDNIPCRFYAFRLLKFTKTGKLVVAGYPDPFKNIDDMDIHVWLPDKNLVSLPSTFNIQSSMKILEDVGGQFCRFVQDEREALKLNWASERKKRKVVWKKCVNGIREMCDVCKTSIFNNHWSCGKCGFVVCVDCFRSKLKGNQLTTVQSKRRLHEKKIWLRCSHGEEHQIDHLNITQILAGDALNFISKLMHNMCITHNIPLDCGCSQTSENLKPPVSIDTVTDMFLDDAFGSGSLDKDDEKGTNLKSLLTKLSVNYCSLTKEENKDNDTVASEHNEDKSPKIYVRKKEVFAPKLSLLSASKTNVPHMWLCEGHLLRLLDPKSNANYDLFQEQWKRGQPVLVSDVGKNLNSSLWHPESFSRDFGDQKNDLINCITGNVVEDQPMSKFWDGFENAAERLCDKQSKPMLLKLKDWPPSEDFAETLPDRFEDLMNCLPLNEYTHRNGRYNLASRLPECFVRPDLGPKMYIAYGNAGIKHKEIGTTNLHLDISDAVNVMVYVAITKNSKENNYDWHVREALKVIKEAGCDDLTMRRVFVDRETPGALWHIYHSSDADSIRDLLNKVAVEHGTPLEKCSDPIHDQSHYLDDYLRERLFREYGVKGYAIVQCYGDAIFIPAGAPHQVRNLHNCIKVAEDFVSPENVHHSFCMTQEFRNLTDSHTNHEDKLQIKNIVFHAVKDSIAVLTHNQDKL